MSVKKENQPKGVLIAIGGAVDRGTVSDTQNMESLNVRFQELGILRRLLKELAGKTNRVEIITTASRIPEETGQHYIDAFQRLGNDNIGVIHIRKKADALNPEFIERIQKAEGVLFTGGDQLRLIKIFLKTEFLEILHSRYQNENVVVAGTSAGAMAMSKNMIGRGSSSEALLKGTVKMFRGLDFMEDVIFDSHFIKRGRFGRLCQAVASIPSCVGIGLGEDTGLLITKGDHMEAIGTGLVMIVEGDHIQYTDIDEVEDREPISIEGLTVHVLSKGHSYILSERRLEH